ncbi:MAG: 6-phosphofructokinase [Planctomycetota bacterium]|nr:6-phosphofructokinase [Planctomycetota bacterium]
MAKSRPELLRGNAIIGQSGGPTAVINQSLVGVVEGLRGHKAVGKIFGSLHGVRGMVSDQSIELQKVPQARLNRIANTPSSALGSSRDKPDPAYCQRIMAHCAKYDIRYFFYIGGNDSSDTCRIVDELAKQAGHAMRCFHVPKTIDNDLMSNDHTPGYASAAKFVAQAFIGDDLDNRALPGIKINVIMGRHAGFLTAASLLARRRKNDGPHLIYVPEVAFNLEKFLADVERIYTDLGRCVIAVSEGIHHSDGTPMLEKLSAAMDKGGLDKDAHGNVQLSGTGALGDYLAEAIKKSMARHQKKVRIRADTLGYLQRSFAGCTSPVDAKEARASGKAAAKAALAGSLGGSMTIQRVGNSPYKVAYKLVPLTDVAAKTRHMDPKFLVGDNDIAESFRKYLAPLVGDLPEVDSFV